MSSPRLFTLAVVIAATAAAPAQANVPSEIAVPDGNKRFLTTHAEGVQIYSCNGQAWTLVAPRANLLDRRGKVVGTHFAGPTWKTKDGSTVVGARVNGVKVDPTAIDWLLQSATPSKKGRLSGTTFIQRVETTGGLAPAPGTCTAATAGTTAEVPYTAVYHFWKASRGRCD
jgi:hypothetical protein